MSGPELNCGAVLPILGKIAIFAGLNERQLLIVFRLLGCTAAAPGSFIFEAGDAPRDIYIVQKGKVEILLPAKGSYLAKAVFTEGDCFGETGVIGNQKHTASAMALEPTELIVLSRTSLFQIWDEDKEIFGLLILNIAREACRRLNQTDETILHYFSQQS